MIDDRDQMPDEIRQALWETQRPAVTPDVDAEWQTMRRVIAPPHREHIHAPRRWPAIWTAIAATVIVAIALMQTGHPTAATLRDLSTPPGSRATIHLHDGTQVVLGPDSHLRVSSDFGQHTRTVELEGEAYFTVVHNAQHPFAVHVHGATITDVGTVFDVRSYGDDPDVRVAVATGAVSVMGTELRPGDMATVAATGLIVTHNVNIAALTAWTQGRLVFDGTPLRDVVRDIGRTFNVQITIADSTLAAHQVSGTFDNETIDQVLDDITSVTNAQYQRTGRTVVIRRRTASNLHGASGGPPPVRTALHE